MPTNESRVNPYSILLGNVLPSFAEDSHEMVVRIFEQAKNRGEEVDIQDGFDLYKQLASIRGLFAEALPEYGHPCFHKAFAVANVAVLASRSMWRVSLKAPSGNGST